MCEVRSQRSGRERSDEMVTLSAKGSASRSQWIGAVAALVLVGWAAAARAQGVNVAASDLTGGYVVLPKIIVHTTGGTPAVLPGQQATDTIIQMTNTNQTEQIRVDCWWVNANSHCGGCTSIGCGPICDTNADCVAAGLPGLNCVAGWSVQDLTVQLTSGQPIGFLASSGLSQVPCDKKNQPVPPLGPCIQTTTGSNVKAVPEDPFRGELKCVQVDENDVPVDGSDLKLEATIVSTTVPTTPPGPTGETTAASYNAIGFASDTTGTGDPADPLCLGSLPPGNTDACAATYAPCPGVLILDHFFEGATPEFGGIVNTDLTLVPCSEDLGDPTVSSSFDVLAQMLVYNEFEQRFSTSAHVSCYRATTLADIDTVRGPLGDQFSVFSVGVEGTLTGQTRIRGVQGPDGRLGYGLLGVACENYRTVPGGPVVATDAFNLHHSGFRPAGDAVYRTQFPVPPGP
jgi:hypothetical protein